LKKKRAAKTKNPGMNTKKNGTRGKKKAGWTQNSGPQTTLSGAAAERRKKKQNMQGKK